MRLAEEPLTKVTLNLFAKDVEYFKSLAKNGNWTIETRNALRQWITWRELKQREIIHGN